MNDSYLSLVTLTWEMYEYTRILWTLRSPNWWDLSES